MGWEVRSGVGEGQFSAFHRTLSSGHPRYANVCFALFMMPGSDLFSPTLHPHLSHLTFEVTISGTGSASGRIWSGSGSYPSSSSSPEDIGKGRRVLPGCQLWTGDLSSLWGCRLSLWPRHHHVRPATEPWP